MCHLRRGDGPRRCAARARRSARRRPRRARPEARASGRIRSRCRRGTSAQAYCYLGGMEAPPPEDPTGRTGQIGRIGNYDVEAELGRGGMGVVYRCRHPQIGRRVAIKVLNPEVAANPEMVARFYKEAQTAAELVDE